MQDIFVLTNQMTPEASDRLQQAMVDQILIFYTQRLVLHINIGEYLVEFKDVLYNGEMVEKIHALGKLVKYLPPNNINGFLNIWEKVLEKMAEKTAVEKTVADETTQ